MSITAAQPTDLAALTRIAIAAKSHWGYPAEWMAQWHDEFVFPPAYLTDHPTFITRTGESITGFCSLKPDTDTLHVEHLWILPTAMGAGFGRDLFNHAESWARAQGARQLVVESDPHATGFYERMGAVVIRQKPAPMPGAPNRALPILRKPL